MWTEKTHLSFERTVADTNLTVVREDLEGI